MKISIVTKRAILKQMCKDNNIDPNNVYIDKKFGYVRTVDFAKKDVDQCETTYDGVVYRCDYTPGCFYPFLFMKEPYTILN